MSVELVHVAQVATIVIACCSISALIMGIHLCQMSKSIKRMNICGRCITITQFSGRNTVDTDDETPPIVPNRFSRDIQTVFENGGDARIAPC